jgi:hypothetical protein
MAAIADRLAANHRPLAMASSPAWVPLAGCLWVVVNVLLISLGIGTAYPLSCAFVAGILDGTIISVIAVAKASDRFQAGTTGLLSGLSLSGLRSDQSLLALAVDKIHALVDAFLVALNLQTSEELHLKAANSVLCIFWTALLVVLASLIAEWIRTLKAAD